MSFWVMAALVAAGSPHVAKPKLAVLNVEARGVEADKVPLLTEVLSTELQKTGAFEVMSGRDVEAILGFEAQKQLLGCDEASCFAELGGALGADELVVGQVGQIGDTYVVNVKLIDVRALTTTHRVSTTTGTALDNILAGLRTAARDIAEARAGGPFLGVGVAPASLWGAGLVALGAGAFFGMKAKSHHDNATTPGYEGAQIEIDRGVGSQRFANVGFGLGLAGAAAGLIVWLVQRPSPEGELGPMAAPLQPTLSGLALSF